MVLQHGFLLTRHSEDTADGSLISYWLATHDGPVKLQIKQEKALFFIKQSDKPQAEALLTQYKIPFTSKALNLKTFEQAPVQALYFNLINDHFKAQRQLKKANITLYEHDIRLENRFLNERFIHAGMAFIGEAEPKLAYTEYKEVKIKAADVNIPLSTLSLDIECSMKGELYSIGLQGMGVNRVLMIGKQNNDDDVFAQTEALQIVWLDNEKELLQALELHLNHIDPDIIIGWHVVQFDFRLLIKRAALYGLKLKLGRGFSHIEWRDSKTSSNLGFINIPGRVVIDGIDALKTATYHFDSFSLEFVSQQLLDRGKKVEDVDNRVEHITHDFHHNKSKLAAYNLEDCQLVSDIFEQTQLLDFLILRSQLTGLELDRSGGSVAAFTNVYLPKLHRAAYVAPNLPADGGLASPGGYVMSSIPGLYKHVLVLDFKSLYPSIIRTFKIDPLGLIEGLLNPDNAIEGFKGALFSRKQHFLPQIITELWAQRDQAKKNKDNPRSQAIKILMNSFYGVLGSGGCRFYDTRLASSITMRGHEIMQQTAKWIEDTGYKVIYGDTDSTFVWLNGDYSDQEAQALGDELAESINLKWQQQLQKQHQLDCHLEIEFETHFERFLMPTIRGSEKGSKKRYAGVINKSAHKQLIFKGLETVRSDWTALAKEFQTTLYEKVFNDEEPSQYVRQFVEQTRLGHNDDKLVYRKRLRRKLSDYVKNVPPHVKAARILAEEKSKKASNIQDIDTGWISYVITLQGPQPLEYQTAAIDHQHYIDKQIMPIADGILPFVQLSFAKITDKQLSLF